MKYLIRPFLTLLLPIIWVIILSHFILIGFIIFYIPYWVFTRRDLYDDLSVLNDYIIEF